MTFMCSHSNDKNKFYIRGHNTQKTSVTYLIFVFRLMYIFEFWLGEKQLIHISPFHSRSYVLMGLGCLEASYHASNWNKGKTSF